MDDIITNCLRMAKSMTLCTSPGVAKLAKYVFLDRIASDERLWGFLVQVE